MQFRNLNFALIVMAISLLACEKDTPALPDNTIAFEAAEMGFDSDENAKTLAIQFSRAAEASGEIIINVASEGIDEEAVNCTPAVQNGKITVDVTVGQTTAEITVTKRDGVFLSGDEWMTFTIETTPTALVIGDHQELKLQFSSIVSAGATMTLQGGEGGSTAANSVFVDFSNNQQTSVMRQSWNLGFYCGDEFAVILNNTTGSTALEVDFAVDKEVSNADAESYATALALTRSAADYNIVDDWSGDLSKTIVKEGKVYVVNLGDAQTPLYKVKVSQKDNNTYTLQYAKITESTVTSVDLGKETDHHFIYFSFTEGKTVTVPPQKTKWDIMWSRTLYQTGAVGATLPYIFSDLVFINIRDGVEVTEVISDDSEISKNLFEGLTLANAQSLTYSSQIDVIGSNWRNGGGPNTDPSVKNDRFYVVKDPAGNYYKLQFLSINEPRGYPQIKYVLIE